MSKKAENEPRHVWAFWTAVGGVIFTTAGILAQKTFGLFTPVYSYLAGSAAVPRWVVGLLTLGTSLFLLWCLIQWIMSRDKPPEWDTYRSDIFERVKWEWQYLNGRPYNPAPICPRDEMPLVAEDVYKPSEMFRTYRVWAGTVLVCDCCRERYGPYPMQYSDLIEVAKRHIQRKINTGEWRQVVGAATARA